MIVEPHGATWTEGESLYNRGRAFRAVQPNSRWPEAERTRIDFVSLCRAQLGYLLSQLFCQHCCLGTEGLDVSEELEIAAFFAIYDYGKDAYIDDAETPGVIFRINVGERPRLSMQHLKEIDFYSCPFFASGTEILNLLGRCATQADSFRSLAEYFREKQDLEMTLPTWNDVRTNRPLELIMLPHQGVMGGRVMMQRAGLVFPDIVLPRWFEEYSIPPPPGKTWDGPQCVEDLAKSDAVEAFFFHHERRNKTRIGYAPATVFPKADPLRSLLSRFISTMSGGSLAIPIVVQDTSVFGPGDEEDMLR